jgi:putative glutamine amidotransferase
MTRPELRPVVLVPACNRQLGHHPFHIAGKKYVDFVRLAGCLPLVVPNAQDDEIDALLDLADGVLLTGSPSNVHPRHFDEGVHDPDLPLDVERDRWTLPFIPRVLARGLPLFAICRGTQETNVALGGSLHQAVQDVPGYADHRAPSEASAQVQYAPVHEVEVMPGGVLPRILDRSRFQVNSVHGQGVNRLARDLHVEARAPDGLIEAFSIPKAAGFNLCVQWHPEWQASSNPISVQLARAFGAACRAYRQRYHDALP